LARFLVKLSESVSFHDPYTHLIARIKRISRPKDGETVLLEQPNLATNSIIGSLFLIGHALHPDQRERE
jgi:hypothetical protein